MQKAICPRLVSGEFQNTLTSLFSAGRGRKKLLQLLAIKWILNLQNNLHLNEFKLNCLFSEV